MQATLSQLCHELVHFLTSDMLAAAAVPEEPYPPASALLEKLQEVLENADVEVIVKLIKLHSKSRFWLCLRRRALAALSSRAQKLLQPQL